MLSFLPLLIKSAKTSVEVSSQTNPVEEGGILAINCEIRNMRDEYTVQFLRIMDTRTEQLTMGDTYMQSTIFQRVFLAKRKLTGTTAAYFLTIVDVLIADKARYVCNVNTYTNGISTNIGHDNIDIEVYTFPKANPICQIAPNGYTFRKGDKLVLTCTSANAHPVVDLEWSSGSSGEPISAQSVNDASTVYSDLAVFMQEKYDGTIFICTMRSRGFPDRERSCYVGPITMSRSNEFSDIDVNLVPSINSETKVIFNEDGTLLSHECMNSCSTEDEHNMIIYLGAGSTGATILMITFLISTIVLCYKYCMISEETRAAQMISSGDGSEPVYVSLQRRPEPDRSSMFLSVEDPNNPGSKVLMPRELVEEFYRSLSLKRKK